ncbi:hypothetical protein BDZ94DRAFT_1257408 [Collybia nuda]|uniref:Uncharacterized protein n=1 Tax=Collybia nuda TaxID=64659 RepID=A0A9P6CKN3_9AGAR|nr:hypothetical protein BDZ94DRAFT_1257408 [Collybia nuda]
MKFSAITIALAAALLSQTTNAVSVVSTTVDKRGLRRPLSLLSVTDSSLKNRAADSCVTSAPYGCDGGRCWKVCDSAGGWCWTAKDGGTGDWETCNSFNDCNTGMACGVGDCADCGCTC